MVKGETCRLLNLDLNLEHSEFWILKDCAVKAKYFIQYFFIAYLHCDFFRQRHQSTMMRKRTAATTKTKNIAKLDKTRTSTFLMVGMEVVMGEKSTKMGRLEFLQMASKTKWRTTRGRKATRMLSSSIGRGKYTTRQLLWPTLRLWSANIKRRRRRWSWLFWISWLALPQNFVYSEKQSRLKKDFTIYAC